MNINEGERRGRNEEEGDIQFRLELEKERDALKRNIGRYAE